MNIVPATGTMPSKAGWGARIETCVLQIQALRRERLSLDAFGELVAKQMGRDQPFKKASVSQWISEVNEPTIATFDAIAALAQCEPSWIVWGRGKAPANVSPTSASESGDERPTYVRVAEQYGGEVAQGSTEMPDKKKTPAKQAASGGRRRPPKG